MGWVTVVPTGEGFVAVVVWVEYWGHGTPGPRGANRRDDACIQGAGERGSEVVGGG